MVDKVSKKKRSQIMSRVRSKETALESKFRTLLWGLGLRYRKNSSKYFGTPDLVAPSKKLVVFLDSCFWHGCKKHLRMPAQNRDYWKKKIAHNIKRDKEVNKYYKKEGWKLVRVWEHQLKTDAQAKKQAKKLMR